MYGQVEHITFCIPHYAVCSGCVMSILTRYWMHAVFRCMLDIRCMQFFLLSKSIFLLSKVFLFLCVTEKSLLLFRSCPKKESPSIRALLALHDYIDPSSLKEVVSTLLLLPQKYLVAPEKQLSVYGHAVLKLLSDSMRRFSEDHSSCIALSQAHLQGLAALLTSSQCVQLEDFLLQVQIWHSSPPYTHSQVLFRS